MWEENVDSYANTGCISINSQSEPAHLLHHIPCRNILSNQGEHRQKSDASSPLKDSFLYGSETAQLQHLQYWTSSWDSLWIIVGHDRFSNIISEPYENAFWCWNIWKTLNSHIWKILQWTKVWSDLFIYVDTYIMLILKYYFCCDIMDLDSEGSKQLSL